MKTIGTHVQGGGDMAETRMTLLADLLSASTSGSRRVCKHQTPELRALHGPATNLLLYTVTLLLQNARDR